MGEIETRLVMTFSNTLGRKISLFVTDPREDITETEIKAAMDLIIEKNIFEPNGADIIAAVDAKIIQTETTEFDLEIA
ncbi:DUF2922 domain-containing protein [Paraclostridium sordellii]|uniref:DUF2922 domain-containing protein n=1 Tax=Paraclostridium sordellii TaxID=1505 RepID=UPI0005DD2B11|nr:DUF2922 domain-containing protein [Paeniclostridium sordellii]CEP43581.1 hypothetical protein DUF2922 [[Clostridium] sordellii] [Paeniclostridium sordellii]CEP50377.1 hypothetical protein DUF2922 [[Clostridium] sordellii] [Paeniclostridium sordellii]